MAGKSETQRDPGRESGRFVSLKYLEGTIEKKADEAVVDAKLATLEAKLKAIEDRGDETHKIALSARKSAVKPHECSQSAVIDKLSKFMENTKTVKVGAALALAMMLGSVVYASDSQSDRNDATEKVIVEVKNSMERVETEVSSIKETQRQYQTKQEATSNADMEKLVGRVITAFSKANEKSGKKKR